LLKIFSYLILKGRKRKRSYYHGKAYLYPWRKNCVGNLRNLQTDHLFEKFKGKWAAYPGAIAVLDRFFSSNSSGTPGHSDRDNGDGPAELLPCPSAKLPFPEGSTLGSRSGFSFGEPRGKSPPGDLATVSPAGSPCGMISYNT